jgi:hypothetical protein
MNKKVLQSMRKRGKEENRKIDEKKSASRKTRDRVVRCAVRHSPQFSCIYLFLVFFLFFAPFLLFNLPNSSSFHLQSVKMVHLARVKTDLEVSPPSNRQFDSLPALDEDDFYSNVYGSHFAADHLNQNEMPEREMPRQIAARMIKDELSLDGNPKLNLASFVTTYSTY